MPGTAKSYSCDGGVLRCVTAEVEYDGKMLEMSFLFIGYNENAVKWQVWTGLLVHMLLRYLRHVSRWKHSFSRLAGVVRACAWLRRNVVELLESFGANDKVLKGWGAFYSVGYPSRVFRKVNHYVLKRMARFLNRKSQRYYRLKFADSYYGELAHYGLHRLAWADVRRTRN